MSDRMRAHIITLLVVLITLLIMLIGSLWMVFEASRDEGPWGGVPYCTHEIANAGGVCHGDPR